MKFYYVYVLLSEKDKKLYTGYTENLQTRFECHNNGLNKSTKNRRPFKLIYSEAYISEKDARAREIFLKSGRGREILNKQLSNTFSQFAGVV